MIDTKELRRLAEAATPGEWDWGGTPVANNDEAMAICRENFEATEAYGAYFCEVYAENTYKRTALVGHGANGQNNAAFIAAANPSAILSLLDKIDALEKDAARYRWLRNESWAGYNSGKNKPEVFETVTMVLGSARNFNTILAEEALDEAVDAALLSDTSTQEVG